MEFSSPLRPRPSHFRHHARNRIPQGNCGRGTIAYRQTGRMYLVCTTGSSHFGGISYQTGRALLQCQISRKPVVTTLVSDAELSFSAGDREFGIANGRRAALGSAVTVVLAVMNRVLYKLALVPMKQYPFFLAQTTTFGYVAVYFSILWGRYYTGIVTKEMLSLPKMCFIMIGFLEALGAASGMAAAAMLPGPTIPILSQTFLVWQLAFSAIVLRSKYSVNQILGCLLVAAGVVMAIACGTDDQMHSQVECIWPILMIASSGFQAAASVIKEFVFIDSARRLQGKTLDIFAVNSFGSGFQALFILLLLPLLTNLSGVPLSELPSYLKDGATCFLNTGADATGCGGAPLLPLLYISVNMAFNISVLSLTKMSSAVVASLAAALSVPAAVYVLSLPLPYISQSDNLSPSFAFGSVILVLGLFMYNLPQAPKSSNQMTE